MTYKKKIIIYFLITFVLYTTIIVFIQLAKEKRYQTNEQIEVLKAYSDIIQHYLQTSQDTASALLYLPDGCRLTIMDNEGNVSYDNVSIVQINHMDRPEIQEALQQETGTAIRKSKTTHSEYLYVAQKVPGGFVRIALPYVTRFNDFFQLDNILLYVAAFLFFTSILLAIYFSDKFWGVMETLKKFAASAEKGTVDYNSVHFPDTDSGEIGSRIISLYKQLETSKLQIIEEKDRNRKMKQEMTNNIAHELKTPVSSIRGYLEILLGDKPIDEEKKRYFLERSYSQTLRLSSLINDVSMINKMEESSDLFKKELINISTIAQEAIDELDDKIVERNITVINNLSPNIKIIGNHSLIYGIFRNLIENAISYAGESITIGIECRREDVNFYYFRLYDTGCGVAEKYLTRIFDRFLRIDEGRSRKTGGTGLGLSIVKHAVLFHEGGIVAKNAETGGLEFYFSLKK